MNIIESIKNALVYSDGALYWVSSRKSIKAGARAGSLKNDGYRRITIDGKSYGEFAFLNFKEAC